MEFGAILNIATLCATSFTAGMFVGVAISKNAKILVQIKTKKLEAKINELEAKNQTLRTTTEEYSRKILSLESENKSLLARIDSVKNRKYLGESWNV